MPTKTLKKTAKRTPKKGAAKKPAVTGMEIKRDDQEWGVRLSIKPFLNLGQQFESMVISVDINNAKKGHTPDVKVWFSGVPPQKLLPYTYSVLWGTALNSINEKAREVAEELKSPRKKK